RPTSFESVGLEDSTHPTQLIRRSQHAAIESATDIKEGDGSNSDDACRHEEKRSRGNLVVVKGRELCVDQVSCEIGYQEAGRYEALHVGGRGGEGEFEPRAVDQDFASRQYDVSPHNPPPRYLFSARSRLRSERHHDRRGCSTDKANEDLRRSLEE